MATTKRHDDYISAKVIDVENDIKIAGSSIMDAVNLVTATATQLNYLDDVTPGTVTAGKAIVTTTNRHIDALVISDGGLALGSGAGTAILATAAEINLVDASNTAGLNQTGNVINLHKHNLVTGAADVTASAAEVNVLNGAQAGTAVASKALVLDSNKHIDTLAVADGGLKLGAGAGTAVTSTAAELNILDDCTATYAELNYLDIVALGTGAASKAVVLDANSDYVFPNTSTISWAGGGSVSALRIGNWKAGQAAGNAVVFAAGMDSWTASDGQLDALAVFGESVADLTAAYSAKAGRFRHLVTFASDTVINQETYGAIGQLVIKNASLNHYHAGLMGTFETTTDCDIQTSYGAAAIIARTGGAGTTVESGGLLAGFLAVQHMSAVTASAGKMAAFASHKTATGVAWPIGLFMQSGSVTKAADITANSDGFYVTVSALTAGDAYSGIRSVVTAANPNNSYGLSGYFEANITGSQAGSFVYGLGSWINVADTQVGGGANKYLCAQDNGIYMGTPGEYQNTRVVFGLRAEAIGVPADALMFPFSINTGGVRPITALFDIGDTTQMGLVTGKTEIDEYVPFFRNDDGNMRYVHLCS